MHTWAKIKKMLPKNCKTIAKTIAQAIWKNIAIVQYFCCLKNYLNTAFFEKKYCNRVFAIFYCAITMVWTITYHVLAFDTTNNRQLSLLNSDQKKMALKVIYSGCWKYAMEKYKFNYVFLYFLQHFGIFVDFSIH